LTNEFSPENIEKEQEHKLLFVSPELLLHPPLPTPLHGINPRTIMGKVEWDYKRRAAYSMNDYHCWACGVYAPYDEVKQRFSTSLKLHAHEDYRIEYQDCYMFLNDIVALCPTCHNAVHINRSQALYDKGVFDEEDMYIIFTNKENVLNLNDDNWGNWYLLYEGKQYYSKFKDRKEWKEHYAITKN
jgi:hypothetical protein